MWERIEWSDERAEYICSRSHRYAGSRDIEPGWTQEAVNDPQRLWSEPDPRSWTRVARIVGYSPSAGFVLTVICVRDDDGGLHGANAWKTTGRDRRDYLQRQ